MTFNLKAYKAGYGLRVTIPKSIYDSFTLITQAHISTEKTPWLLLRVKVRENKPYFAGYDFGLLLYLKKYKLGDSYTTVYSFGKTKGFTLPKHTARELGITAGTRLQCDVIQHTEPECHDKAVAYKVVY